LSEKIRVDNWIRTKADEILDRVERYPFAPRGSTIDPDVPNLGFTINTKIEVWADNLSSLYEKAKSEQWNASSDIPWSNLPKLPDDVEKAVSQLMTFLAENEYIALYLPAKFLPRINPHFAEVALFLSTQVADEARHVEAFSRRALLGAGLQNVSIGTQHALKSLLDIDEYVKAKFLLNILGEGTFEDLFTFLMEVVPDPVTRKIIKLAKRDESRHVAYGVRRTKYQLDHDPSLKKQLVDAIEERASYLYTVSGADPFVTEALAVIAGGGSEKAQTEAGMKRLSKVYEDMHNARVRRLILSGFDKETALKVSLLHSAAVKSFM